MNPVDHPMGGGEGRSSGGHPRSRKGLLLKDSKLEPRKKLQINILLKEGRNINNYSL
jgi:large subunit ribosomal protein L2